MAHQVDTVAAVLPRMQLALAPDDIREWEGRVHLMRDDAAGAAARFEWPWFGGWFGGERVRALVDLGRRGEARATLDSMLAEANRGYFNAYDPMLTPLHADPRFAMLLRTIGRAP